MNSKIILVIKSVQVTRYYDIIMCNWFHIQTYFTCILSVIFTFMNIDPKSGFQEKVPVYTKCYQT